MTQQSLPILDSKEESEIKNLIYTFRGKDVMLDSDLAELFQVETKKLNQQVKRNQNRFPKDFCFRLNTKEIENLRSQFVTAKRLSSKRRYNPYVFTEEGIIALAGVLKSEIADEMCVKIARVFIKMKNALIAYAEPLKLIGQVHGELIEFKEYTLKRFDEVFVRLEKLEPKKEVLLLDDEWFDAYEAIVKLIEMAKESIVLVDPYVDDKSLVYLSHKNEGVEVTLYKSNRSKLKEQEIEAFNKQYGGLVVKDFNESHNRYLILDFTEVYDLGTSLNSMGNKIFTINKEELKDVANVLINKFCNKNGNKNLL